MKMKFYLWVTGLFMLLNMNAYMLHSQHLFELSDHVLSENQRSRIAQKAVLMSANVPMLEFQTNDRKTASVSIDFRSKSSNKLILLNEQTGQYVTFTPVDNENTKLDLSPFLMEELRQSVLGKADSYFVLETSGDYYITGASKLMAPQENVYLPKYYYGHKSNVQEAKPENRRILGIYKQKPEYIPAFPDDEELLRRIAELEEENSYYEYIFELPDGTLCTYSEVLNPEESPTTRDLIGRYLQFELSGSLNETQRTATEYALNLWGEQLDGVVPLDINITFTSMGYGILGGSYRTQNFLIDDTWYPSTLYNQIVGYDATSMRDIRLEFNTDFSFYFGLDGNTSGYDYVTIALHEVTHGLGFYPLVGQNGNYSYTNSYGSSSSTNYPSGYDRLLCLGLEGGFLVDMTASERSSAVRSNNLYADGPLLTAANNGSRVRIYAPSSYSSGSSTSHWAQEVSFSTFMKYAYAYPLHTFNAQKIAILCDLGWTLPSTNDVETFEISDKTCTSITLDWILNEGRDVVLLSNENPITDTLEDGVDYTVGMTLTDGSEILFAGNDTSFIHESLTPNTSRYYKICTKINADFEWSEGVSLDVYTDCAQYMVVFDANGGEGAVEPQPFLETIPQNLNKNEFQKEDYYFIGWSLTPEGDVEYLDEDEYLATSDTTLYAYWKPFLTITATCTENGVIDPAGIMTHQEGDSQDFTITPDENCKIGDVLIDGVSHGSLSTYSFENIQENHTIHVIFEEILGIEENNPPVVKVYAHLNQIFVTNESDIALKTIQIVDLAGRIVYQNSVDATTFTVNAVSGTYIVRLISEDGEIFTTKVRLTR